MTIWSVELVVLTEMVTARTAPKTHGFADWNGVNSTADVEHAVAHKTASATIDTQPLAEARAA